MRVPVFLHQFDSGYANAVLGADDRALRWQATNAMARASPLRETTHRGISHPCGDAVQRALGYDAGLEVCGDSPTSDSAEQFFGRVREQMCKRVTLADGAVEQDWDAALRARGNPVTIAMDR